MKIINDYDELSINYGREDYNMNDVSDMIDMKNMNQEQIKILR